MMDARGDIVGRGELAQAFARHAPIEGALIVAAGVSDSSCSSATEFERERSLLRDCIARAGQRAVVYFGSCGVVSPELLALPYYRHKLEMEQLVSRAPRHAVLRLPQLVGRGANRKTLVNAFNAMIEEGVEISLQRDSRRYFIDVDDVVEFARHAVSGAIDAHGPLDVACPHAYSPMDLVRALEAATGRTARWRMVEGGVAYPLDTAAFCSGAAQLGWRLDRDYLSRTIARHYGSRREAP